MQLVVELTDACRGKTAYRLCRFVDRVAGLRRRGLIDVQPVAAVADEAPRRRTDHAA